MTLLGERMLPCQGPEPLEVVTKTIPLRHTEDIDHPPNSFLFRCILCMARRYLEPVSDSPTTLTTLVITKDRVELTCTSTWCTTLSSSLVSPLLRLVGASCTSVITRTSADGKA